MPVIARAQGKKFTFPDGTSPEQMGGAIDEFFSKPQEKTFDLESFDPAGESFPSGDPKPEFSGSGIIEPIAAIGSSVGTSIAGGLAGLGAELTPGNEPGVGGDVVKQFQEASFQPKTRAGQENLEAIGSVMQGVVDRFNVPASGIGALMELISFQGLDQAVKTIGDVQSKGAGPTLGERTFEETGSPAAAAAAATVPDLVGAILGTKGAVRAGQAIPEGTGAAVAETAQQTGQAVGRGARRVVSGAEETAEQSARRSALESEGLDPLRAQVTRDAGEFQSQQELAKKSGPVRARLEQQEARLSGAFEQRATDTQGQIVTSTSTAIDEVLERSIRIDEEIGGLYRQAREAAPNSQDIRLNRLASNLQQLAGEENISGGLISSVRSNLRSRGILDDENRIVGRISVDVAEQIRQDINLLHNSVTDRGRQLSRQLKDSLDDDVFSQRGADLFDSARTAKRNFEQGLNRANISKFDKRKASLVRDMLDNKVNPDTFVNDVVFAKKWRSEDINQLRLYLRQSESGQQAWNDLRAQTINEIRDRSFKGPIRSDGVTQSLSRDALEKTLNKLGNKVDVLFSPGERAFFNRMQEVARLREPPPATFAGKGPSAQAISQAKARFPVVGPLLDSLSEFRTSRLLLRLPRQRN